MQLYIFSGSDSPSDSGTYNVVIKAKNLKNAQELFMDELVGKGREDDIVTPQPKIYTIPREGVLYSDLEMGSQMR